MRLFIPPLGVKLRLTADWRFTLHRESRCRDLFTLAGWGRENSRLGYDDRSSRTDYRGWTYPNGYKQPSVMDPPLTKTRFDFGEPVSDPEARVHPSNTAAGWSHDVHRPLACHVEGNEVVLDAPPPPDAARVVVTARVLGRATADVVIPAGRVIAPARYYIRNGASDFDSVTFNLQKEKAKRGQPPSVHGRFWAKLADANRLEYELAEQDVQPWWHGVPERLLAGETVVLAHDVPKVPGPVTVAPLVARTVLDLPDAAWLVYAEGPRVHFWLRDRDALFARGDEVPGASFGTKQQFRGSELPVSKIRGYVTSVEGL